MRASLKVVSFIDWTMTKPLQMDRCENEDAEVRSNQVGTKGFASEQTSRAKQNLRTSQRSVEDALAASHDAQNTTGAFEIELTAVSKGHCKKSERKAIGERENKIIPVGKIVRNR